MTPVSVSVLTQSGPDFLGLDQNCFQVQITGCHKVITQRLFFYKRVTNQHSISFVLLKIITHKQIQKNTTASIVFTTDFRPRLNLWTKLLITLHLICIIFYDATPVSLLICPSPFYICRLVVRPYSQKPRLDRVKSSP